PMPAGGSWIRSYVDTALVRLDCDRDLGPCERAAERDQLVGLFAGENAGDARGAEHVALLGVALEHQIERRWRHHDAAFGDRDPLGCALRRHVDHARLAAPGEMGEPAGALHKTTPRRPRGFAENRAKRGWRVPRRLRA